MRGRGSILVAMRQLTSGLCPFLEDLSWFAKHVDGPCAPMIFMFTCLATLSHDDAGQLFVFIVFMTFFDIGTDTIDKDWTRSIIILTLRLCGGGRGGGGGDKFMDGIIAIQPGARI
jgi:hypothetical protein